MYIFIYIPRFFGVNKYVILICSTKLIFKKTIPLLKFSKVSKVYKRGNFFENPQFLVQGWIKIKGYKQQHLKSNCYGGNIFSQSGDREH